MGKFQGSCDFSREVADMDHVMGKSRDVSGFRSITTCRDGLENSRDKSATNPFASGKRRNCRCPRLVTGNQWRRRQISGDITGLSQTCRGCHGEVGIMEFGLTQEVYCCVVFVV